MKYKPGSFSKNFAWHGTGLRKLHTTIKAGFSNTLAPVYRTQWRTNSGIGDADLELIPINFFLHNKDRQISVDELVFQAIKRPHSLRFDRLALFAFHLNRAGAGRGVVHRPAMWANEFVRKRLWADGGWQESALPESSLDSFIDDRMDARPRSRTKCRTNYRHLFELCDYLPSALPVINSGAERWIGSALFLAWDRHILNGGTDAKAAFITLVDTDELYKLLGVPRDYALQQADYLADLYTKVGGLDRFLTGGTVTSTVAIEVSEEAGTEWIDQEESDEVVERTLIERLEEKRDRKKAAALKRHYDNACIFCGVKLRVAEDRFYSEAAHIKPLGKPHSGPDKTGNMLVLCPNHHLQFDRGTLRLWKTGEDYEIRSDAHDDPLHGHRIALKHSVDDACVEWHRNWFRSSRE